MATFLTSRIRLALACSAALMLSACGDGGFGSSGEQAPDPVAIDIPVVYIKRSIPLDEDGNMIVSDIREPVAFNGDVSAELFIRDRASPSATERSLTAGIFPDGELYDVRDVSVNAEGTKVLFAMRAPEIPNADDDEQPTWNIWEYDRTGDMVRRVIASDIVAEDGQDISPAYLADGRIVFASTRQRLAKAILLDEGKPQFSHLDEDRNVEAMSLHVMNPDGSEITQITFNQSHDMYPTLLDDGRIVFMRWDNTGNGRGIHFYTVNPDGSNLNLLYGLHSHLSGTDGAEIQFLKPKRLQDGRVASIIRPFQSELEGGDFIAIDHQNFIDIQTPIASMAGMAGPAQVSLAPAGVTTDGGPSLAGRYRDIEPMLDGTGRYLVSWSQCRLLENAGTPDQRIIPCTEELLADPDVVEAPPLFSLYLYDPNTKTQVPLFLPEEGVMVTDPVVLLPTTRPAFIPDGIPGVDLDANLVAEGVGVVHIKSVYDLDGVDITAAAGGITTVRDPAQTTAAQRPARFLRILKPVSMPDDDVYDFDNSAFGFSQAFGMQDILGYVPVEPDGSAMFKVPANVAFTIQVLDGEGKRINSFQRHNNLLQVKPGEVRQCNGCHTATSLAPHGRQDAEAPSINPGAPTTGVSFPNTEPALFADMGETMAQVWTRINGPRTPSLDIVFDDEWTDPNVRAKDPSFAWQFADLTTAAPTSAACLSDWNNLCRTTINYVAHIQPIWLYDRSVIDPITGDLISDDTCTSCHSRADANGAVQVPAGQIELVADQSAVNADFVVSFVELFRQDQALVNNNGVLIGDTIETRTPAIPDPNNPGQFLCNQGILDTVTNECVVTTPVNAPPPPMRVGSARNSTAFFNLFAAGGSHQGRLSDAELKLIAEWLDIGAQYYNNPFEAPED
ncbi:PD40 domain-containing protein [Permianibacter aggregans]|uniref:WD40 repeat protein n=1 Tax=Permianibacter aggregans TaxID=1510150 RepID=A0A4R6UTI2_9GAMM|nr:PD40 domain-containing protein [Permianibacter aggregans]QGX38661.1 hypothetical protein E2H98_02895 [Permianibacter aggregans]TDQ50452.1 WD40 repeat protein [Permianibacter aggregans]